jgi:penicillin-binding protein 1A
MTLPPINRQILLRCALIGAAVLLVIFLIGRVYLGMTLPSVESLRELQLSVPLRVLTSDGKVIDEFGIERRDLTKFADIPEPVTQAFIAAEDANFYAHSGVDYFGLLRAGLKLIVTGEKSQGGSTITMQLARNVFLSSEKTFGRKFREILLAQKIEKELSKDEILELYLNKIYLGERAYGIGAAAKIYFDKDLKHLSLSEAAVLASLPKAPSANNPVKNPARATERRNYVLRRMHDLGFIDQKQFDAAVSDPLRTRTARIVGDVDAHYVAEMVRSELYAKYGEEAYSHGYTVVTTIVASRQQAATDAVRRALLDYDERHGYRGAEAQLPPALIGALDKAGPEVMSALDERPLIAGMEAAVVTAFTPEKISALMNKGPIEIAQADFKWANLSSKRPLKRGDFIHVRPLGNRWRLAQEPQAQGAFVALNPKDGAIEALVGGYDFFEGKFNRVTQAKRQLGSGFKPYLYSAALAHGYTPASVFLDAPVVFDDPKLESSWRPENYGGEFSGPMRMREGLVQSRNLVSIRILMAIGIGYARDYIPRFGMAVDRLPRDLTMALGSAVYTPLEQARGYATIANGGFLIDPYFIKEVRDASGTVISKATPKIACPECEPAVTDDAAASGAEAASAPMVPPPGMTVESLAPRVIDAKVIWMVTDMMRDVVRRGTGAAVAQLGRSDLAGKTGTTNDETDAWFNGFQKTLVGISWVGFDQPSPLGRGEVGGRAALPIWMDFMKSALRGVPQETLPRPQGLTTIRINPTSGRLDGLDDPSGINETVPTDRVTEIENTRDTTQKSGVEELY